MNWDSFKRVAKDMREAGVQELGMFYIGESMICPWIAEAVDYAKSIGFPYVFLTTNGSLATAEKIKPLMAAGLDSLKWSLNNADKWQFRQITGMAPSMFDDIKKNVKDVWQARKDGGYKTRLYASSIKYDGDQQVSMQSFVDEIKPFVDEHYWLPLLSFGSKAKDEEVKLGLSPVVGNPGRLEMMRQPMPCWACFKEGHITHDLKLSACCFDSSDAWVMADLNEVSFMEGWNSEAFQKLRAAHLNKDVHGTACHNCIYPE
jgi:MoaA/NifB/PqqE/SkfB family radical SAM enzyme